VEYALGHPQLGRDFRRYLTHLDVSAAATAAAAGRPAGAGRRRAAAAKKAVAVKSARRKTRGKSRTAE
jgi:hypothetical protein